MPQANYYKDGDTLNYTPGSAVTAGDIIISNGIAYIAKRAIAASALGAVTPQGEGVFDVVKDASTFSVGDPVYWKTTGDPVGGTAGSGAATSTSAGAYLLGYAALDATGLTGDTTIRTVLIPPRPRGIVRIPVAAVTAAGSAQGDAAQLYEGFNAVTGADATKGVILPTAAVGMQVSIKNITAAILKIYPATGGTINALSANGALSIAASTTTILTATSTTQWYSHPLLAS